MTNASLNAALAAANFYPRLQNANKGTSFDALLQPGSQ